MNFYIVKGTSRAVGAIGISEPFAIGINAHGANRAYALARVKMQDIHEREHVLVMGIERFDAKRNRFVKVPSVEYLGA